ncbi:hypothetical protein HXT54_03410 [Gardnerella sp. KA00603]|jgi:hypothetical protein|uniref:Uncharacterized protein n=1 Tax=Gardnerella vaginalis TaxID=2702 RepID=A0A3E1IPM9_GARVA|nr:hypothetical protein [Gardnerella vaginalis]EIK86993.1 hypothetical protein CGSMWGv6119V5_04981 [Gardnerella vaginalis 6119V5]RFD74952.1 hypothetical protein AXE76_01730 [Gardnerella vaginalis]RIY17082.1 hypothetical protein CJI57_03910 [Bifidobacteriaceae bacterium WP012]
MKINIVDTYEMDNDDENDDVLNNKSSNNSNDNNEHPPHVVFNARTSLPVYEGELSIALSRKKLEYHIGTCYFDDQDEKDLVKIALRTCQIACIASDISRGRPTSTAMKQLLTPKCVTKLNNMWKLMDDYFQYKNDMKTRSALCAMPAVPSFVNGMLTNPHHFEGVVHISAGPVEYWASIVLEHKYNKWICTYADLG